MTFFTAVHRPYRAQAEGEKSSFDYVGVLEEPLGLPQRAGQLEVLVGLRAHEVLVRAQPRARVHAALIEAERLTLALVVLGQVAQVR